MARTARTSPKPILKGPAIPEYRYDTQGKITNWSALWPEAKQLKEIVYGDAPTEHLKPAMFVEHYPQFKKFAYRPFASALHNIRKAHEKEISDRCQFGAAGNGYANLQAQPSEPAHGLPPVGNEELLDEADDGTWVEDGVSCLSLDEETVAYKSVKFVEQNEAKRAIASRKIRGRTPLGLQYVLDYWVAKDLSKRVSLQILLFSGKLPKGAVWRVSTDQTEFVLSLPVNKYMLTPESSFNSHLFNTETIKEDQTGQLLQAMTSLMDQHPKTIARRSTISKMKGRDENKVLVDDHRIPLPIKCRHGWVSKAEDNWFNGAKIVTYPDGSRQLHVELCAEKKDSYSPMKDCASVRSACADFMHYSETSAVPTDISVNSHASKDFADHVSVGSNMDASIASAKSMRSCKRTKRSEQETIDFQENDED